MVRVPSRNLAIRRPLSVTLVVLSLLLLAGSGYERIALTGDAERYPAPGELIEIGDHQLPLVCLGAGSPTVVLEAGLGESALGWAPVQRELAAGTRVCSHDRAGLAWSGRRPGDPPRSAARRTSTRSSSLQASQAPTSSSDTRSGPWSCASSLTSIEPRLPAWS